MTSSPVRVDDIFEQLSHVSVRQLGPDDWQVTRGLRLGALRDSPEAFGGTFEQAKDRTEQQWRVWPKRGVVYAAYLDDVPVGLACGWLPEDSPGVTELISMWVAPAARGRRIAGALIDAVAAWAQGHATHMQLEIMADNSTARRVYIREGFTIDDRPANCSYTLALRFTPARRAAAAEIALLPSIEKAADRLLIKAGIKGPLPEPSGVDELAAARTLLVVGAPPVGFARIEEVDGAAHLEQLSVHPGHARRGIGTVLLIAACRWAAENGYRAVTLITFADVPFNALFYARHGFKPVADADLTPGLRELRSHEAELGLDALGDRFVMRRTI